MNKVTLTAIAVAATALFSVTSGASAQSCVNKAGEGTGGTKDSAMFQAYEAVLQATDWGMWSAWMASSQKVGVAPGYKVSKLSSKCTPGGLGLNCRVQATLCKG